MNNVSLPAANGLMLIADIKALAPEIKVIVITGQTGPVYHERARAVGADALVPKDRVFSELGPALEAALA